jgi:hypothetical protein
VGLAHRVPRGGDDVVDEAVAGLGGCRYQVHFDSDTDGDGEIDAGGSETQTARPWADEAWTGILTIHGNDDALVPTVDSYLDGVAGRIG